MIRIQYIRTATLLWEWEGIRVLTDPWFAMQMRGLPVFVRPCVRPRDLPPLDLILVSHLHPDHFDQRALRRLSHRCKLLVGPPGVEAQAHKLPVDRVEVMQDGDMLEEAGFTVRAFSVEHSGYENAYHVERNQASVLFAGDASFSPVFERIGRAHPPTVSLLPVGGTRILGRRIVMNPDDALVAAAYLRTRVVVPIHLGGEWMSVPPLSLHPGRAHHLETLAAARDVDFQVAPLRPGQTLEVDGRGVILC